MKDGDFHSGHFQSFSMIKFPLQFNTDHSLLRLFFPLSCEIRHTLIKQGYTEQVMDIFLRISYFPYCFIGIAQWIYVICDSCQEQPHSWNAAQNAIHSTRIISSHGQEGYTALASVQTWELTKYLTQEVIYSTELPRKTYRLWQGLKRTLVSFQRRIIGYQCLRKEF